MKNSIEIIEILNKQELPAIQCEEDFETEKIKFCRSPYDYICSASASNRLSQMTTLKSFEEKFEGIGLEKLNSINSLIKDKKLGLDQERIKDIKKTVIEAISKSQFPTKDKERFKTSLDNMEVIQAAEYVLKLQKDDKAGLDINDQEVTLYGNVLKICGDGLSPVAFAEDTVGGKKNEGKKRVVVCDGSLLLSEDLKDRNLAILMHEMSHFFSPRYDMNTYKDSYSCLVKNMGERILKDYELATLEDEKEQGLMNNLTSAQMNEISCDLWAADAFSLYHEKKNSKPEVILKSLKESYGYFCDTPSSGVHPSGRMRIEIIGNNSNIRKQIGCTGEVEKASQLKLCTF